MAEVAVATEVAAAEAVVAVVARGVVVTDFEVVDMAAVCRRFVARPHSILPRIETLAPTQDTPVPGSI